MYIYGLYHLPAVGSLGCLPQYLKIKHMLRNHKKRIKEKLLNEFGNLKTESFDFENIESYFHKKDHTMAFQTLSDYFGKSEPPLRQSEPPVEVGWICM